MPELVFLSLLWYACGMDFSDLSPAVRPRFAAETSFTLAASDCQSNLKASLPALERLLQEAAGLHAEALGVGIQALQRAGFTWMLGRLALRLHRSPAWREQLRLTTWPSGIRGRLMAERQFVLETEAGERLLEASSEWLCVDMARGRLAKLPESAAQLANAETLAFGLCTAKLPPVPAEEPCGEAVFNVRRAEIDANRHVNNVHYAEWMLETLPEEVFFCGTPRTLDIEFKQAAHLGDTVVSRTYSLGSGRFLHSITSPAGVLLARASTGFSAP